MAPTTRISSSSSSTSTTSSLLPTIISASTMYSSSFNNTNNNNTNKKHDDDGNNSTNNNKTIIKSFIKRIKYIVLNYIRNRLTFTSKEQLLCFVGINICTNIIPPLLFYQYYIYSIVFVFILVVSTYMYIYVTYIIDATISIISPTNNIEQFLKFQSLTTRTSTTSVSNTNTNTSTNTNTNTYDSTCPKLLCIGDTLTNGYLSANYTTKLLPQLLLLEQQQQRNKKQSSSFERSSFTNTASSSTNSSMDDSSLLFQQQEEQVNDNDNEHYNFYKPLYIINGGYNYATTTSALQNNTITKLIQQCNPNYTVILLGTNDILCLYNQKLNHYITHYNNNNNRTTNTTTNSIPSNNTTTMPTTIPTTTMDIFESNIRSILLTIINTKQQQLQQQQQQSSLSSTTISTTTIVSSSIEIAICTIPPIGEDLTSTVNVLVQQANTIIEKIVEEYIDTYDTSILSLFVIPFYEELESIIIQNKNKQSSIVCKKTNIVSIDYYFIPYFRLIQPLHYILDHATTIVQKRCSFCFRNNTIQNRSHWNTISKLVHHTVVTDGVHLNETSRDVLHTLLIQWLTLRNIRI